ncbi:MAG: hypothetical protein LC798_01730 [Chloroflexi bacterium]|nr:hypothetical protein [Chloroflexota bacterium]
MTARALPLTIGVLVAGVLIGSGLAALGNFPPDDPCVAFGPEGSSSSGTLEFWPLGTRCEYSVDSGVARSEFFGPSQAELYASIVVAALIGAMALLKRDAAFARGAVATATLLALLGFAWHYVGVQFTFFTAMLVGPPVAFTLDHVLRPSRTRSARSSMWVAVVLAALVFWAPFVVIVVPWLAIAVAVLAGALASTRLTRPLRPLTT